MSQEDKHKTIVSLDKDDVDWFVANYGNGNLSWILTNLLSAFRNAHEKTPIELMVIGAQALKEDIDKMEGVMDEYELDDNPVLNAVEKVLDAVEKRRDARLVAAQELMQFHSYSYLQNINCWVFTKGFRQYSPPYETFEQMLDEYIKYKNNADDSPPK